MSDPMSLAHVYAGWDAYQQRLLTVVAPLSADQLQLEAAPHLRSVFFLTAHIISARVWWFHYVLREGSRQIRPLVTWDDDDQPLRSAEELVEGLQQTWTLIDDCLDRWTTADLDETFQRQGDDSVKFYSRQWIIWHVFEHDMHHGGELSFVLGMHHLSAIDL